MKSRSATKPWSAAGSPATGPAVGFLSRPIRPAAGWLFLACLQLTAPALDPGKDLHQFKMDNWQVEAGLPQNSIHCLCQTRNGYLWMGTEEGLVRFDGIRFQTFDRRNTPDLAGNIITCLLEDSKGTLWIGTRDGGAGTFRNGVFRFPEAGRPEPSPGVNALLEDQNGDIWAGTDGDGLYRWRQGRFTRCTGREGPANPHVRALAQDEDGVLWLGTGDGVWKWTGDRFEKPAAAPGGGKITVNALATGPGRVVWAATTGQGLWELGPEGFRSYRQPDGLASDYLLCLRRDRAGTLWIGGENGGICRLIDGKILRPKGEAGLSSQSILSFLEDREGNLWAGTQATGLFRFRETRFFSLSRADGLSGDIITAIYEDSQGSLWVGTDGCGLNRIDGGKISTFGPAGGLADTSIHTIIEPEPGILWFGTARAGLQEFRKGAFRRRLSAAGGLGNDFVIGGIPDGEGGMWVSTFGGLCQVRDGKAVRLISRFADKEDLVFCLLRGRRGEIWAGTRNGLLGRLHNGEFIREKLADDLPAKPILALHEDAGGALWIGTDGGGLCRLQRGSLSRLTSRQGLFDDIIFVILEDSAGWLWMTSNRGIFRIAKQDFDIATRQSGGRLTCIQYGLADGLHSSECNGEFQPAGCKTRRGYLWFPTVAGLAGIDPVSIRTNQVPPLVEIEQLVSGRQAFRPVTPLIFPTGRRDLEIQFTGLSLTDPQRVIFRYFLEGYDAGWTEAGTRRSAFYTRLPPGDYRFRVQAANEDGIWNRQPAEVRFTIVPRFYETGWFYLLAVLVSGTLVFLAYRWRIARLKQRELELQGKIDESLARVKILSGLIPICASCKKIRDDQGYWNQLEQYIHEHSEAAFSHGICPDCLTRLYPEFAEDVQRDLGQPEHPPG